MTHERVVFVHGSGRFGAAAWPNQHGMALKYDCLFVRRHGFDVAAEPLPTDFDADAGIVLESLGSGGHVVAHSAGAVSAMMAAVQRPDLVRSLVLVEPACLSLTMGLPATAAHISHLEPLYSRRAELTDMEFHHEFARLVISADVSPLTTEEARRGARRLRLQSPPWEAPLQIVPGVPTMVLTGGWEPLYEEVAGYLVATGAQHLHAGGGHRPHDSAKGQRELADFVHRQLS